jgi:nucleoside phosphorylase
MNENNYKEISNQLIQSLKPDFNHLIVTATKIENDVLHEHLKPIQGQDKILHVSNGKQTYFLGKFGAYNSVHVACGEMGSTGPTASTVTTLDAINAWNPKAILMVGIAFGAEKKQNIGDVLVSEVVVNYEPERVGRKETIARGKHGPASTLLVDRFKSVKGWVHEVQSADVEKYFFGLLKRQIEHRDANVYFGLVLSGEKLVDNAKFKAKMLKAEPTAIGGEMEGAGIYAACDQKVKDWILVKGICDYADGNKKKDKKKFQNQAIRSAVSLCEHVFSSSLSFEDIGLIAPSKVVDIEKLQKSSNTLVDGLPMWMHTHVDVLKKGMENEN